MCCSFTPYCALRTSQGDPLLGYPPAEQCCQGRGRCWTRLPPSRRCCPARTMPMKLCRLEGHVQKECFAGGIQSVNRLLRRALAIMSRNHVRLGACASSMVIIDLLWGKGSSLSCTHPTWNTLTHIGIAEGLQQLTRMLPSYTLIGECHTLMLRRVHGEIMATPTFVHACRCTLRQCKLK